MAEETGSDFDPRLTPARPDLAAKHLEGKVTAARFVEGRGREVIEPQAVLRDAPAADAPLHTEALQGERVTVYETTDEGWAWGQLANDGYVGWLPAGALGDIGPPPTHRVAALRTLAFPGPSIKLPPVAALSFGARVNVVEVRERLARIHNGSYIPVAHLVPAGQVESDWVATAERFVGVPYLWGGKTSLGLDCSALVQLALQSAGINCPRDSDLQEQALGELVVPASDDANLRRGDLLFWPGHVGIVRDGDTLLHANALHMAVAVEPLREALQRIAAESPLRSVKRLAARR